MKGSKNRAAVFSQRSRGALSDEIGILGFIGVHAIAARVQRFVGPVIVIDIRIKREQTKTIDESNVYESRRRLFCKSTQAFTTRLSTSGNNASVHRNAFGSRESKYHK